jgi:hypothetical protein
MDFSIIEQGKGDLLIQVVAWTGLTICASYCNVCQFRHYLFPREDSTRLVTTNIKYILKQSILTHRITQGYKTDKLCQH